MNFSVADLAETTFGPVPIRKTPGFRVEIKHHKIPWRNVISRVLETYREKSFD